MSARVVRLATVALAASSILQLLATSSADGNPGDPSSLPPDQGGFTKSLGLPPIYKGAAGFEVQWFEPSGANEFAAYLDLGLSRDLGSPVVGIAGVGVDGYGGFRGSKLDGGARALFLVPSLLLGLGVDYNFGSDDLDFLFRLDLPVRRGGVFGRGTTVALRWLPGRNQTFGIGINAPLWGSNLGKTRARHDYVELDARVPQRLEQDRVTRDLQPELDTIRERAHWIQRLSQPFVDHSGADPRAALADQLDTLLVHWADTTEAFPQGHTLNEEIQAYHEALDRAFSIALEATPPPPGESTELGRSASTTARRLLLDNVLYPYNATLGQRKKNDTLSGMVGVAQAAFARWALSDSLEISKEAALDAFWVFQTLCDVMEENRAELRKRWEDSRFVFLPLQYGLKPEDHDTQEEMDAIVASSAQAEFSSGNRVRYVVNEEFQWELARSVQAAENYHVLWIHDIRGVNDRKEPDEIAYRQVTNYLTTLCRRVEAYDRTSILPIYMIFLDQHYFEINKSRVWMRFLQDPLGETVDLPSGYEDWERSLQELQDRLRKAVAESVLLRVEGSQYGEKWVRNRIKVQVNITNPADPSFRSYHVAGILPIPDNMMRDHRKIAFYDVTEEDPYRGMAMFTGMGVGEHYVGANWEDRAVMIQGPEALAVKDAARQLLLSQGFSEEEIPYPLRPLPFPADYESQIETELGGHAEWLGFRGAVLQLHNQTGFFPKQIDPAKAALYSLMPPGSVIKVPDSLWQDYLYASLLAGSALRGCRVLIIAPTADSAPSAAAPTLARAQGLLGRLIVFDQSMGPSIASQGGLLKVGLYAPRQGVGDIAGRLEQAVGTTPPWADQIYKESPAVVEVARNARSQLDSLGYRVQYLFEADSTIHPKMHLKANLLASKSAWDNLISRPEWAPVLYWTITYAADLQKRAGPGSFPDARPLPRQLSEAVEVLLENYVKSLTPREREELILYLTVGSVNMDYRSMVMDGEAMIVVSGWEAIRGMIDFVLLAGQCEWPESPEELDQWLPPPGGLTRSVAGLMKLAL